jgi:methyltransferase (TIGR00027 family)
MTSTSSTSPSTSSANVVRSGTPSPSAWRMAALRGVHALLDVPLVFDDPFALAILGPEREAALRADPFVLNDPFARGLRAALVVRARVAEDALAQAVEGGLRQVVVLGAGLDTLALRSSRLAADLRVWEVDAPSTQARKREALAQAGLQLPATASFVPVDFERDDLRQALESAGVRFDQPVFFTWLVVTMYLSKPAIRETLRVVASAAPGSAVVFDYRLDAALLDPIERVIGEFVARQIGATGEPFVSEFEPAALAAELRDLGLRTIVDPSAAELSQRYLARRQDGLHVGGAFRVMTARASAAGRAARAAAVLAGAPWVAARSRLGSCLSSRTTTPRRSRRVSPRFHAASRRPAPSRGRSPRAGVGRRVARPGVRP